MSIALRKATILKVFILQLSSPCIQVVFQCRKVSVVDDCLMLPISCLSKGSIAFSRVCSLFLD